MANGPPDLAQYGNGQLPDSVLVSIGQGGHRLSSAAAQHFLAMKAAAAADGITLKVSDSYRTYDQQVQLVKTKGLYAPGKGGGGAVPGTSEHGWGQAVDFAVNDAAYAWLQQHSAEYGFVADTPGEVWHYGYHGPGSGMEGTMSSGGRQGSPSGQVAHAVPPTAKQQAQVAAGIGGGTNSIVDAAREQYGWLAFYLDMPVVGDILRNAAAANWTSAKLQNELMATDWWQSTQSSVRVWDAHANDDPATASKEINDRVLEIRARANSLGFSIDITHVRDLAAASLRFAYSPEQIDLAIGGEAQRGGTLGASTTMGFVRSQASAYGVPVSDQTLSSWGQKIALGEQTQEDYREWLVKQAVGLFPGFEKQLLAGMTVADLANPYLETAASTLGVSRDSIDLADPKWGGALNTVDPNGSRRILTLNEWNQKLKSDPVYGWDRTPDAIGKAFGFADQLGKAFGKVA